jgi:hypothetical protein
MAGSCSVERERKTRWVGGGVVGQSPVVIWALRTGVLDAIELRKRQIMSAS